jgi:hypothetical protein
MTRNALKRFCNISNYGHGQGIEYWTNFSIENSIKSKITFLGRLGVFWVLLKSPQWIKFSVIDFMNVGLFLLLKIQLNNKFCKEKNCWVIGNNHTSLCIRKVVYLYLFVCHIEISQIRMPLAMFLAPLESPWWVGCIKVVWLCSSLQCKNYWILGNLINKI